MKNFIEPPVEPVKEPFVRDYECICKHTDEWDEGEVHITETRYEDLIEITLEQLNEIYKDYNPGNILIRAIKGKNISHSLAILRPEKEEEFEIKKKKYKEKLAWYENWKKEQK